MRIMVVDASRLSRDQVIEALSELTNFAVHGVANDVQTALKLLEETAPDVVILDLAFPDGDGGQIIQAARRHPSRPGVVVFAAMSKPMAAALDADLVVDKTSDLGELTEGVRTVALARQRSRRARAKAAESHDALVGTLLDLMPSAGWITSLDGSRVEVVNGAAAGMLGPRVAMALQHDPSAWMMAVHPEDVSRAAQGATARRARGLGAEYRLAAREPGRTPRAVREEAIVVRDRNGEGRVIITLSEGDIAGGGVEVLARRFETLGRIAAGVAHDLANYLTVVDVSLKILHDRVADASARVEILRLRGAMESAATLTQNLVSYARGDTPARGLVDLAALVRRTLDIFRRAMPPEISVLVDIDDYVPEVEGVASELEQLLVNLVLNARDAMPSAGQLRVSLRSHNRASVELEVCDSGSGISELAARAHGATSPSTRNAAAGTGLGLGVVRSVAERHDARVEIAPRIGGGTRVTVSFMLMGPGAS